MGSEFKDTYFRNMFIPIIFIVLVFTFAFIVITVPIDLSEYTASAANSASFLFKG